MEIWKPIPGYEGHYEASTQGRIRSVDKMTPHPRNKTMLLPRRSRILKQELDKCGYPVVTLSVDAKTRTFKVHRLIAMTFLDNPDNLPQIDHINSIRYDNRPENLRWCTSQENTAWRDEKLGRVVICKETRRKFKSSFEVAAWLIYNRKTTSTNLKVVARQIRRAINEKKVAYSFHWAYLEGSTTIPKGSREKSRNGETRVRREKI